MNISEFFQQSAGKWVSQRSSHRLAQNQSEGAKADLMIETLGTADPDLQQLCQQQGISAPTVGLKITWSNGIVEHNPKPQSGSSLVVAIPDPAQPQQGQIISRLNRDQPVLGRYELGQDQVLILTSEAEQVTVEERIWFASENFRLRTNVIKRQGSTTLATFCSEIRMGGKPPADADQTAEVAP
ncbi:MAG: phycobiliprotein lyase [Pegethrix bostrychoides GSE-TBD4-15B]|jgi:hypothetical protein|uniref:Chromophore lyase CpcS/CpeS n=1 Tax=Pegethrix bostrychoides GSE-TBD4-15B TaxID=2839662 RepID=A0A951PAH0_9CYAN|nr:phycobiliprotein lyase [Pegethrix bostrychoides GSE-TBD4-15B]